MNIDWATVDLAAIGSMIGGIGTILAFVGTSLLSWLIYCQTQKQQKQVDALETDMRARELALEERQAKLKEYELKISLFGERQKVRNIFMELNRLIGTVLERCRRAECDNVAEYVSTAFREELARIGILHNDMSDKECSFYYKFTLPLECARYCYSDDVWKAILSISLTTGHLALTVPS